MSLFTFLSGFGSVEDALSSLLHDEHSRQTNSVNLPSAPLRTSELPESSDIPPLPETTVGRPVTLSNDTRKIASANKGPESLPFFDTEVVEDGLTYWKYTTICDESGAEIVYTSPVRPEHLRKILSVTLDDDGYIQSVDFHKNLQKHTVSDFLKARFCGINLEDPNLPPICTPTPQPFPVHFALKSLGHRFSDRNVTSNPNKVSAHKGKPPSHNFAAHFRGECRGCKHTKYDAGLVEAELLDFARGATRDLQIQMRIRYETLWCVFC